MSRPDLRLTRFHRVGAAVHAVALSGDGEHALVGSELGLHLMDRRGNVNYRLGMQGRAFSAVALSPRLDSGLAMERAGRLYRLNFETIATEERGDAMRIAAVGIWEQRDDLYSLDFAPEAGAKGGGLIALGHHALGLTALDGRGQLLWRLGPREAADHEYDTNTRIEMSPAIAAPYAQAEARAAGRSWHATISADGKTIYAASLGGAANLPRGRIVAIDATLGKPVKSAALPGRVTLLASLPAPLAVAAVTHEAGPGGPFCRLVAFEPCLQERVWTLTCPPGATITAAALAPGQAALVIGTNGGELWRVGAFTGRILARYDLLFASTVLSVAVAESGEIAAGLANGQVAYLERVNDER